MPLAAIRGATTLDSDSRDEVVRRTRELVEAVFERNALHPDDVVSIMFTATPDVTAEFPAMAVRDLGHTQIPLLCATEMAVPGAMPLCVRCLVHAEVHGTRSDVQHVYLRDAQRLRPDLAGDA
ncbi:MAG: chorismate mutase [Acidimicrobiia bacterium]|nr:chorismate mutase [Acidimicrobiia bacterium]